MARKKRERNTLQTLVLVAAVAEEKGNVCSKQQQQNIWNNILECIKICCVVFMFYKLFHHSSQHCFMRWILASGGVGFSLLNRHKNKKYCCNIKYQMLQTNLDSNFPSRLLLIVVFIALIFLHTHTILCVLCKWKKVNPCYVIIAIFTYATHLPWFKGKRECVT